MTRWEALVGKHSHRPARGGGHGCASLTAVLLVLALLALAGAL